MLIAELEKPGLTANWLLPAWDQFTMIDAVWVCEARYCKDKTSPKCCDRWQKHWETAKKTFQQYRQPSLSAVLVSSQCRKTCNNNYSLLDKETDNPNASGPRQLKGTFGEWKPKQGAGGMTKWLFNPSHWHTNILMLFIKKKTLMVHLRDHRDVLKRNTNASKTTQLRSASVIRGAST